MNGRRNFSTVVSALLLAIIASAAARAAENVLTLVPDDAWGFAVVNRVAETNGKIEKLGERLGAPLPNPLAMFKATTGIQKGLDEKGDALLVVVPPDEVNEQPQLLTALPVTDYEAFVNQFEGDTSETIAVVQVAGEDVLVARKAGYAVFTTTESKALLEEFLERKAKLGPQVAPLGEWLAGNDVAAAVLPAGVKVAMDKALDGLNQGRAMFQTMGANAEDNNIQAGQLQQMMQVIEAASRLCSGVKTEVAVAALGARFDAAENVFISSRVRATPDGKFDTWTKAFQPKQIDYLAGLPAGPFVFAGGGSWSGKGMEALMRWSFQMMKANPAIYGTELSDEDVKKLTEVSLAARKGVHSMSLSMAPGEGDEALYSAFTSLLRVDDAARYLADYEKAFEAWRDIVKADDGQPRIAMDVAEVQIAGASGLKVTIDMSGMFEEKPIAEAKQMMEKMMEKMMGEGGKLDTYVVAADKKTIVIGYVSEKRVTDVVKNIQSGGANLRQDSQVRHTAKLLPRDVQMVGYLSPSGLIAMVNRLMTMLADGMGGQIPLVQIPPFAESPPVGCSVKIVPGGLQTESVAPDETLKALGDYIHQFQQ